MGSSDTKMKTPVMANESSREFVGHIEQRIIHAAKKEHRLSIEECAQQVRVRRMEKYGF